MSSASRGGAALPGVRSVFGIVDMAGFHRIVDERLARVCSAGISPSRLETISIYPRRSPLSYHQRGGPGLYG